MSYTLRYGKEYEEWCKEKAKRILDYLKICYYENKPLDFQDLAYKTYFERLIKVSKEKWKTVNNRFLDFKPSPFMHNFLYHVRDKLLEDGFLKSIFWVEVIYQDGSSETFTFNIETIEAENEVWDKVKELEALKPKKISIIREDYLKSIPSLEWLENICIFSIEE